MDRRKNIEGGQMTPESIRKKRLKKSLKRRRIAKAKTSNLRAPKYERLKQAAKDSKNHERNA
jgi:hypothetical protein